MKIKPTLCLAAASLLALVGLATPAQAAEPLRTVVGSMAYPFEVFDAQGQMTGGLLKELGDQLARELGASPEYLRLPRRRTEPALAAGEVDIYCFQSPEWFDNPQKFLWSIPNLKQIERVLARKGNPLPARIPDDFVGKRVSARLGYHYASIQPLFDAGKAWRMDETQNAFMFKAVETGLTDLLITSDGEIEGHFKNNPQARQNFAIAPQSFSVVATQCAVSPKSNWSLTKINQGLAAMMKRGDMDRMTRHYGLSMR
jgi:ABC-type amino acid transport substrate-binding protein